MLKLAIGSYLDINSANIKFKHSLRMQKNHTTGSIFFVVVFLDCKITKKKKHKIYIYRPTLTSSPIS